MKSNELLTLSKNAKLIPELIKFGTINSEILIGIKIFSDF